MTPRYPSCWRCGQPNPRPLAKHCATCAAHWRRMSDRGRAGRAHDKAMQALYRVTRGIRLGEAKS